jgi:NAD(P)-dependent dehydrogenase (short-subunit alcohol dehydrogenase family)
MQAIVTGGNAGLGLMTAIELAKVHYSVTISVRSEEKGRAAVEEIKRSVPDADIKFLLLNMSKLSTVDDFVTQYKCIAPPYLNLLVNNAGIMATPFEMTEDGFEAQFQVNHLSHFKLTSLLMPLLKEGARKHGDARVINLSSRAHLRWQSPLDLNAIRTVTASTYDPWLAYGRSKMCNILFTRALERRFSSSSTGVSFYSLHPGLVSTALLDKAGLAPSVAANAIPVEEGIKTTLFLSTAKDIKDLSGHYFFDKKVVVGTEISSWAQSEEEERKLWMGSLEMTGIKEEEYGL